MEEAKARVQAQRAEQQAKRREAGETTEPRRPRPAAKKPAPRRENAPAAVAGQENRKPRTPRPPREEKREPRHVPVTDISKLQIGQEIKVRAGQSAMDATVLEIAKDGVRVQLSSGLAMIVRAEHLQF